jgi:uncharacterized membrane protein
MFRQLLILVHLLGAIALIGGMFFAYFCLRPAAVEVLDPPKRLPLWSAALRRFLRYMVIAVVLIIATGLAMLLQSGFARAPIGWHVMLALGLVMTAVFVYIHAALYPKLPTHAAAQAWPAAGAVLNDIRRLVAFNLIEGTEQGYPYLRFHSSAVSRSTAAL